MIEVRINGEKQQIEAGTTLAQIAKKQQLSEKAPVVLAVVNGKLRELFHEIREQDEISFVTTEDASGFLTFRRSMCMVLLKAFHDVVGTLDRKEGEEKIRLLHNYKIEICHTIGSSLYCEYESETVPLTEELLSQVTERMKVLIKRDIPFTKKTIPVREAEEFFKQYGNKDVARLVRYRMNSHMNTYMLENYADYFYGYMVPSTGYLGTFSLEAYGHGFVLNLPAKNDITSLQTFAPRPKFFEILEQSKDWGKTMQVSSVADLNEKIAQGKIQDLILVQEALMEKRIGEIADRIVEEGKKVVLIAGPSSSGKTSFSHRLSIQLMAMGLEPFPIPMDDYFVNREFTPIDEKTGKYDFESIKAVDTEQFNKDINDLLAGKEVAMPTFNFVTGQREYKGNTLQMGPNSVLVIEGIHGLNEISSKDIPAQDKFKIYISALTTLNVDAHNRISTSDGRLLRRMVRDVVHRGTSPAKTLDMWQSVRAGEEKNIFPYQEEADVMFNSSLIYEISILKQYVQPLLFQIDPHTEEGREAKRLLKFLSYFLGVDSKSVPNNSILREFIGGSCFFSHFL